MKRESAADAGVEHREMKVYVDDVAMVLCFRDQESMLALGRLLLGATPRSGTQTVVMAAPDVSDDARLRARDRAVRWAERSAAYDCVRDARES